MDIVAYRSRSFEREVEDGMMDSASQDRRFVPLPTQSCSMLILVVFRRARVALDSEFRSGLQRVLRRRMDQGTRWACSCTAPCRFTILVTAFPRLCLSQPPACAGCDSAQICLGSIA